MVTVCQLVPLSLLTLGMKLKLDNVLFRGESVQAHVQILFPVLCARTLEDCRKQTNPRPDYHLAMGRTRQGGVGAPRMKAVRSMCPAPSVALGHALGDHSWSWCRGHWELWGKEVMRSPRLGDVAPGNPECTLVVSSGIVTGPWACLVVSF